MQSLVAYDDEEEAAAPAQADAYPVAVGNGN